MDEPQFFVALHAWFFRKTCLFCFPSLQTSQTLDNSLRWPYFLPIFSYIGPLETIYCNVRVWKERTSNFIAISSSYYLSRGCTGLSWLVKEDSLQLPQLSIGSFCLEEPLLYQLKPDSFPHLKQMENISWSAWCHLKQSVDVWWISAAKTLSLLVR